MTAELLSLYPMVTVVGSEVHISCGRFMRTMLWADMFFVALIVNTSAKTDNMYRLCMAQSVAYQHFYPQKG